MEHHSNLNTFSAVEEASCTIQEQAHLKTHSNLGDE